MRTAPWWLVVILVVGAVEATWVLAGRFFRRVQEDDDAVTLAKEKYAALCRAAFEAERARVAEEKRAQERKLVAARLRDLAWEEIVRGDCAPEGKIVS